MGDTKGEYTVYDPYRPRLTTAAWTTMGRLVIVSHPTPFAIDPLTLRSTAICIVAMALVLAIDNLYVGAVCIAICGVFLGPIYPVA
jgi:fucose permease